VYGQDESGEDPASTDEGLKEAEERKAMFNVECLMFDELVKSPKTVTPVNTLKGTRTGVHNCLNSLESCFRRNDKKTEL